VTFTSDIATLRAMVSSPMAEDRDPGATPAGAREGATGRWFVTPHAVRAYARRHLRWTGADIAMPDALYRKALAEIIKESATAKFVRALPGGGQLWRGARPRKHRFVVIETDGPDLPALATVL